MAERIAACFRADDTDRVREYVRANPRLARERFAPVHEGGLHGDTALHHAAFHGHSALARALLESGADINAQDHDGRTPLELAAWEGGAGVLAVIGPDLEQFGAAALDTASAHGASDRCQMLLRNGARPGIHAAVRLDMLTEVRELLDADPALRQARDKNGGTPLDLAAECNRREIADLLSRGADVHLGQVEYIHRILPIHVYAAAAVDILVAADADVNAPYRDYTPLQRALERGDDALVSAPRRHGDHGRLYLRAAHGKLEMVKTLLDTGADVTERDEEGRTALDLVNARLKDTNLLDPAARAQFEALAELLNPASQTSA